MLLNGFFIFRIILDIFVKVLVMCLVGLIFEFVNVGGIELSME